MYVHMRVLLVCIRVYTVWLYGYVTNRMHYILVLFIRVLCYEYTNIRIRILVIQYTRTVELKHRKYSMKCFFLVT